MGVAMRAQAERVWLGSHGNSTSTRPRPSGSALSTTMPSMTPMNVAAPPGLRERSIMAGLLSEGQNAGEAHDSNPLASRQGIAEAGGYLAESSSSPMGSAPNAETSGHTREEWSPSDGHGVTSTGRPSELIRTSS